MDDNEWLAGHFERHRPQKLQGARSNNRFLDKRIADLEAQLLDAGMSGRT